jgi:hypothetical protein
VNGSYGAQPLPFDDEPTRLHAPNKRGCVRCDRAAELIEVTPDGTAVYLCPERHHMLVDVSKAMRLR